MLTHFLMGEWPSDIGSITVSKFSVYYPRIIPCFHLHHDVVCFDLRQCKRSADTILRFL